MIKRKNKKKRELIKRNKEILFAAAIGSFFALAAQSFYDLFVNCNISLFKIFWFVVFVGAVLEFIFLFECLEKEARNEEKCISKKIKKFLYKSKWYLLIVFLVVALLKSIPSSWNFYMTICNF